MNIRKNRNRTEESSLSFLDVISCGFGAVVLLLLIVKVTAPESVEDSQSSEVNQDKVEELQLYEQELQEEIQEQVKQLQDKREKLAQTMQRLGESEKALHDSGIAAMAQEALKKQFESALQSLDEEMRELQIKSAMHKIGGIPVDSRHVIFVIDTSGSMRQYAWETVREQMAAILDVYPQVDGLQVINDMGHHLFEGYRGRWIRDTATFRKRIMDHLKNWSDFSNSDPTEGIYTAINLYAPQTERLSIYVLGDDFSGSVQQVLDKVAGMRQTMPAKKIRIHAVGFFTPGISANGFLAFSRLTDLTRKNHGTFVGISTRE